MVSLLNFLNSYDEKVACKKILEKKGLQGFQVIQEILCAACGIAYNFFKYRFLIILQ